MTITTEEITLDVSGSAMQAYVARPESGKAPALIVMQEAFGVNEHIKDVTRRLAQQGYVAIAPELFHRTAPVGFTAGYGDWEALRPHIQATNPETIAEDARACYDWLANDRQVDTTFIGSIGFCLGGRSAVIANAGLPLQAAVSFYGGVPPNVADVAREQHGPVLFFWGGLDKHLGPEQRNAVTDAMTQAGKLYINVEISDADHGFFCDARAAYNPNAARQAWALTLSFLATYLK
ncbi:MAG TPA: dienelactone hydrolase family protein [Candidatus Kapabacteria bacterium]|jgi:carboxymethylenebutenolidase|nr:dienelactone hydrolase family protein [Candidatus Kapabacteria bacterium]